MPTHKSVSDYALRREAEVASACAALAAQANVGVKFDADKPDMSLLSSVALVELTKVLDFGAKKYAPHNWRKGIVTTRLLAACLRHTFAYLRGESVDPETGLSHMAHAMCCCMFILELSLTKPEFDDRHVVVPRSLK